MSRSPTYRTAYRTLVRWPPAGEERCHQLVRTRAWGTRVTSPPEHLLERRTGGHCSLVHELLCDEGSGQRLDVVEHLPPPGPESQHPLVPEHGKRGAGPEGALELLQDGELHPVQVEVGRGSRDRAAAGASRTHGRSSLRAGPTASRRRCWGPASARCRGRHRARRPTTARWGRPRGPGRS